MTPQDQTNLRAHAFDAIHAHERLVRRCEDEAGQEGITRLRIKRDAALKARMAAENALMAMEGARG